MDVFQHLDDLRHQDYLFYDFLEDVRDLDQSFLNSGHSYWYLLQPIDDLQHFLDVVDVPYDFFQLLSVDQLLNSARNLKDLCGVGMHLYHFLLLSYDLFEGFNDGWDFYDLFDDLLDVLVDSDYLRNDPLDFNKLWDLY